MKRVFQTKQYLRDVKRMLKRGRSIGSKHTVQPEFDGFKRLQMSVCCLRSAEKTSFQL